MIHTCDDVGGQNNMLMSPELWRKYLKPRMAELYSSLKKINPNIKISYHSDGNIYPIIDDLVEIGLDILNPIQPSSMDIIHLKKRYGKNLCFWGSLDVQKVLPFGSFKEIENEIKDRIYNIAPGGGFIIGPTHNVQIDTPIENFLFQLKMIKKYGKYPVNC